jgi:tetratricopeptide (TPR) repeat protein
MVILAIFLFFKSPFVLGQETLSQETELYFKNSLQRAASSDYKKGLEYACAGQFKEAEAIFNKVLTMDQFNSDAQAALLIISGVNKGTTTDVSARLTFMNIRMDRELQRIESMSQAPSVDDKNAFKQQIDSLNKEIERTRAEFDTKIFNLQSRIDNIEDDVRFIKNKVENR